MNRQRGSLLLLHRGGQRRGQGTGAWSAWPRQAREDGLVSVGVAIEKGSLQTTWRWLLRLLLLRLLGGTKQTAPQSSRLRLLALGVTKHRSASTLRGCGLATAAEQGTARACVTKQTWLLLLLLVLASTTTEQAASSSWLVLGATKAPAPEWASAGTRARCRRAEETRFLLLRLLGATSKKAASSSSLLSTASEKRTTGVLLLVLLIVLPKEGRTCRTTSTPSEETTATGGWLLLSARAEATSTTAKQPPLVLSLILAAKAAAKGTGSSLLGAAKWRSCSRSASKRAG